MSVSPHSTLPLQGTAVQPTGTTTPLTLNATGATPAYALTSTEGQVFLYDLDITGASSLVFQVEYSADAAFTTPIVISNMVTTTSTNGKVYIPVYRTYDFVRLNRTGGTGNISYFLRNIA